MTDVDPVVELRAARCNVTDTAGFLCTLRTTAEHCNTHVICFNAEMLVGRSHAETAIRYAIRSFQSGSPISNSLEMESLLFASGSRQCNIGVSFGLHDGENHLWIGCYPKSDDVWKFLSHSVSFEEEAVKDGIDTKRRDRLTGIFHLSHDELSTLDTPDRITDLVLERVALLQVLR